MITLGPDAQATPAHPPSDRSFGFVWVAVLLAAGLWPLHGGAPPRPGFLGAAAMLALVTCLWPALLAPLNRVWFQFGLLLGKVMTPVISAVLFFAVFTPAGLVLRAVRGDPLRREWEEAAGSYWLDREEPAPPIERMKNQF